MAVPSLSSKQTGSVLMIVVIVAVLAVIAGAGAYVVTNSSKNNNSQSNQQTSDTPKFKAVKASTTADVTALFAAVKSGDYDAKCTMHSPGTTDPKVITFTGDATFYVTGNNKFLLNATFNNQPSHFLRLGNTLYIWSDGKDKGSKFPVTDEKKSSPNSFASEAEKYHLQCESIKHLNDSFFMQPTGVTFIDINSQLNSSVGN